MGSILLFSQDLGPLQLVQRHRHGIGNVTIARWLTAFCGSRCRIDSRQLLARFLLYSCELSMFICAGYFYQQKWRAIIAHPSIDLTSKIVARLFVQGTRSQCWMLVLA